MRDYLTDCAENSLNVRQTNRQKSPKCSLQIKKSPFQWAYGEEAGLTEEGHASLYGTSSHWLDKYFWSFCQPFCKGFIYVC